ncbi:MAG: response regulator transcription factor [Clostridia bacterium]|nr:response regulator transcription factor [Clostridia bacterium]
MIVICVEDSLLTVCALQQTTQQIAPDARVFACLTVAEAVETARENGCDVLLTEIDMGKNGTGGIKLARQIKEINPRVNIIFITVYPEREYAKDVLRLRASGYVRKPFSAAELKKEFDNLRYSVK